MPKANVAYRGLYAYSNKFVEAWSVVVFKTFLLQVFLKTIYLLLPYFHIYVNRKEIGFVKFSLYLVMFYSIFG